MAAPSVSSQAPAPLAQSVVRGTNIFFHVGGADGVDNTSIEVAVQIDGGGFIAAVTAGAAVFPFNGAGSSVAAQGDGYDVTIDYRGQLPKKAVIDVRIDADSTLAEPMTQVNYAFTIDNADLVGVQLVQIAQGSS